MPGSPDGVDEFQLAEFSAQDRKDSTSVDGAGPGRHESAARESDPGKAIW